MNLDDYSNVGFDRGANRLTEMLWLLIRQVLFLGFPFRFYVLKRVVLRLFGARIGRGVIIKPGVKITFPWKLTVGDHVWLGEDCWLLNLDRIEIGANVCLSQRVMVCTGNHDWSDPAFRLTASPINIGERVWVAACVFVGPGVVLGDGCVVTAGSVVTDKLPPGMVCSGTPCMAIKPRESTANHVNEE